MRGQNRLAQPVVVQRFFDDQVGEPVGRVVLAIQLAVRLGDNIHVDVAEDVGLARAPVVALNDGEEFRTPLPAAGRVGEPSNETVSGRLIGRTVQRAGDIACQRHQQAVVEEEGIAPLVGDLDPAAAHEVVPEPHLRIGRFRPSRLPDSIEPVAQRAEQISGIGGNPRLAGVPRGQIAAGIGERIGRALELLFVQLLMEDAVFVVAVGRPFPGPPVDAVGERADPRDGAGIERVRGVAAFAFAQGEHVAAHLLELGFIRLAAGQIGACRAAFLDLDHDAAGGQEQVARTVAGLVLEQHFAVRAEHFVERVLHRGFGGSTRAGQHLQVLFQRIGRGSTLTRHRRAAAPRLASLGFAGASPPPFTCMPRCARVITPTARR